MKLAIQKNMRTYNKQNIHSRYRVDIEGLRAIAVLSVIIFHIKKTALPGGFVGVDIFFVLSGYLITGKILSDLDSGTFSFGDFFSRRIKRLLPAMLFVTSITLLLSQLLMMPDDARNVAKTAVWAIASVVNIYYAIFQDTSYFAQSSNELPLLHLWSLGVEEQFYLIWPMLLVLAYHFSKIRFFFFVSIGITITSAYLAELAYVTNPAFSYYLLHTRCGELVIGALLSMAVHQGLDKPLIKIPPLLAGLLGTILVVFSLSFLSELSVFPGVLTFIPTVGTALIILSGHNGPNKITSLLSHRFLTRIGTISYSAYLWHWPLLAFFRYGYGEPTAIQGATMLILILVLALLTFKYIERPCREQSSKHWKLILRKYAALSILVLSITIVFVYPNKLLPKWWDADYQTHVAEIQSLNRPAYDYDYVCQRKSLSETDVTDIRCSMGDGKKSNPAVLLWGDSNAAHYIGLIGTFSNEEHFSFRNLAVGSCPPIIGDIKPFVDRNREADCRESQKIIRDMINGFDVVVIGAAWNLYHQKSPLFLPEFFETVRQLRNEGKRIIIIGKIPELDNFDRNCIAKALRYPLLTCSAVQQKISPAVLQVNQMLYEFAQRERNVYYFDANQYLCNNGLCSSHRANGEQVYYDKSHLSLAGSWVLGKEIYSNEGLPREFWTIVNDVPKTSHRAN